MFADIIPSAQELEQPESSPPHVSELRGQAQLTVLAFKARVAISADLWLGGFDTHANHDPEQGGCSEI